MLIHRIPAKADDKIRILIADRTSMGTELLVAALHDYPQLDPYPCACSPAIVRNQVRSLCPDLLLISTDDIHVGLLGISSHVPTLLMLNSPSNRAVREALLLGTRGIVTADDPFSVLLEAIVAVHRGQVFVSGAGMPDLVQTPFYNWTVRQEVNGAIQ